MTLSKNPLFCMIGALACAFMACYSAFMFGVAIFARVSFLIDMLYAVHPGVSCFVYAILSCKLASRSMSLFSRGAGPRPRRTLADDLEDEDEDDWHLI